MRTVNSIDFFVGAIFSTVPVSSTIPVNMGSKLQFALPGLQAHTCSSRRKETETIGQLDEWIIWNSSSICSFSGPSPLTRGEGE
jgi:hypothetical protein